MNLVPGSRWSTRQAAEAADGGLSKKETMRDYPGQLEPGIDGVGGMYGVLSRYDGDKMPYICHVAG